MFRKRKNRIEGGYMRRGRVVILVIIIRVDLFKKLLRFLFFVRWMMLLFNEMFKKNKEIKLEEGVSWRLGWLLLCLSIDFELFFSEGIKSVIGYLNLGFREWLGF